MITAKKYPKNPILSPLLDRKMSKETAAYNPAVTTKKGKVFLFYRSEESYGEGAISKINLAISRNGFHFKRHNRNPVIDIEYKAERMGCEDPRIIKLDERYFLTYTAYAGKDKRGIVKVRLDGAFSKNLVHWNKIGVLINEDKSGAIVQNYKYKERYVMYFGGNDIRIAFSKNLKRWDIVRKPILVPRKGNFFDNDLLEGGTPPIITKGGILLIYNGRNSAGKFSVGWAVFDKNNPLRLLKRCQKPLIEPTDYWEKFGKVNNTIFATSLIYFKRKWLLYYGGGDKAVGLATINNIN